MTRYVDIPHRPTRDADFPSPGSGELPHIETIFRDVCIVDAEDLVRVTLLGLIDGGRCPIQIEIGFGDAQA